MNQRKYRAQIVGGTWVYGSYVFCSCNHFIIEEGSGFMPNLPAIWFTRCHAVIPEIVGQWTGLTDKNGTDIYEGDFLTDYDGIKYEVTYSKTALGFKVWGQSKLGTRLLKGANGCTQSTVTGSIHNPR